MRLRDLHRPDRRGKPAPRTDPIPDLVEVALQIGFELIESLPVHSRGALVVLDLPPRLPNHLLGNQKRLVFKLWHILPDSSQGHRPRLIDSTFLVSRPLRSTPTPASRNFTANTGRSASERRIGTQCLRFLPRRAPSATLGAYDPGRLIDARLLTFHATAADQDHAASTPDTAWPGTRTPAKLIPKERTIPWFRCHLKPFRRLNSDTQPRASRPSDSGTSSWSPPDRVKPSLFPVAHHDSLQPTQHRVV